MRIPRITYGAGPTDLTFTLPAKAWVPATQGIGAGREFSAAGVPSTWITRRERSLTITQRFTEDEWPAVRAWLEYAQEDSNTFAWFPDASGGTSHTCYLLAPTIDEEVKPALTEYFGGMEITFTIRRTDGAAIDEVVYG